MSFIDIVILLSVILIVGLIIFFNIKNLRKGEICSKCPYCDKCKDNNKNKKNKKKLCAKNELSETESCENYKN